MSEGVKVCATVRASQSPGPASSFGDWNTMSIEALSRALNNFRATPQTIVEAFMLAVLERALAAHREAALKYGLIAVASTRRSMTAERAWSEIQASRGRAAASTVEALLYSLRAGGAALACPHARRRLAELAEAQLHEVSARLQTFQPKIARAWTPVEVELLVGIWIDIHG
jgi:hypothetical protein